MRPQSPNPHVEGSPIHPNGDQGTHLNVLLARHEDKDVPRSPRQVYLQRLLHRGLHVIFLWGLNTAEGREKGTWAPPLVSSPRRHTASSCLSCSIGLSDANGRLGPTAEAPTVRTGIPDSLLQKSFLRHSSVST